MDRFFYEGFEPSHSLQAKADRLYDKIVETAPSDACISAVLEWDGKIYHCSIEIGSASLPFAVSNAHPNAAIALDKAELNLMRKLEKWKRVRFLQSGDYTREASKATG